MANGYAIFREALGAGSHILQRATGTGQEDYVSFERAPEAEQVNYESKLGEGATGLHLVSNVLEAIDASGAPRLGCRRRGVSDAGG